MATFPTSAQDQSLTTLVSAPAPTAIAGVIAQMQAIDDLLPDADGLKWFNRLYLMVTQQVDMNPPGGAWQNPEWLLHLDVVFAGFYFNAIRNHLSGAARRPHGPRCSNLAMIPASSTSNSPSRA